jgi:O-antigen/teichoic acid export membrane protein
MQMTVDLGNVAEDSARGTLVLATGNTISLIISAIAVFIVARLLGAELYGVYTLSFTVPSLLLLFVDCGINQALTHFSANLHAQDEEGRLANLLRHGVLFKALISLFIFSVALIFSDSFASYVINRPDCGVYIRLGSLAILFQTIFNTAGAVFVGLDHPGYSAIATGIHALVKATLSSLLVYLSFGVMGAITGFVLGYVIAALVSAGLLIIKVYRPLPSRKPKGNSIDLLKMMLRYGFPLYLSSLLFGLSSQLQSVILAIFSSDMVIGNYKAALNFVFLLSSLTGAVVTSLLPAFSKLYHDRDRATAFFTLATKYSALFILPITTLLIIFSQDLVHVIYGASYQSAPLFLSLSILPFFLVGFGRFTLGGFFNGLGDTKVTFKMKVLYFGVFVVLAPLLTQTYDVPGLILALLLSASVETILGAYVAHRRFHAHPDYPNVARIYGVAFLSALPALGTAHILPLSPLPTVLLSASIYLFTYLTLIPLARIVDKSELTSLIQFTNKLGVLKHVAAPIFIYALKVTTKTRG